MRDAVRRGQQQDDGSAVRTQSSSNATSSRLSEVGARARAGGTAWPQGLGVPNALLDRNEAEQKLFKHPSPGAENMHLWAAKEPNPVGLLLGTCDL